MAWRWEIGSDGYCYSDSGVPPRATGARTPPCGDSTYHCLAAPGCAVFKVSGARGRLRVLVVESEARVGPPATCSEGPSYSGQHVLYHFSESLGVSGCSMKWEFLFSGLVSLKFVFLMIDPPPPPRKGEGLWGNRGLLLLVPSSASQVPFICVFSFHGTTPGRSCVLSLGGCS